MLVKSEAILLKKTPYADNSAIIHAFTQTHGVQSFIVQGMHGKSGKAALYQPGNLLEIVFYFQSNKSLKRVKEVHLSSGFKGYDEDPVRLQVLMFCLELARKCLPEEQEDPHTFEYLKNQFSELCFSTNYTWFPLQFLLGLAQVCGLGLQIPENYSGGILQLENSGPLFRNTGLNALQYLEQAEVVACKAALSSQIPTLDISARRALLEKLLYYFKVHLFPDKEIKSFPILMEVLS